MLVAPDISARDPALTDLAGAARAALAADAAVVLELRAGNGPLVLGDSGFGPGELGPILLAAGGPNHVRVVRGPSSSSGFFAVVAGESGLRGAPTVAVWALRRGPEPFEHAGLAIAFARHAAIALACAAADGPPGGPARGGPAAEHFARRLLEGISEAELPGAVATRLVPIMGAVDVGIRIWAAERGTLETVMGSRTAEPGAVGEHLGTWQAWPDGGVDWESCAARVFATGRAYLSNAVSGDPGVVQDGLSPVGPRRLLVVPLAAGGRRVGVLELTGKSDDFDVADVRAAQALSAEVALAATATLARSRLARRLRLEEILGAGARAVAAGRNLLDFLDATLADVGAATSAEVAALVPRAGTPMIWRRTAEASPLERVFIGEARGAGAIRAYEIPARRAGGRGWAAMHVPVRDSDGERLATLSVLRDHARAFEDDEREALSRLAGLVALAWATEGYQLWRAELARRAERQRLGDELHDQVAQLLFVAGLRLDVALEAAVSLPGAAGEIERARGLVQRADRTLREVVHELAEQSLDDLEALLGAVAAAVEDEFGRPVQLELAPDAARAAAGLPRSATAVLVKVAREALVNAAKHAGPCQLAVHLRLSRRGRLLLTVSDDGLGTVGTRGGKGHGLVSLRRAVAREGGVLRVRRPATGGTTINMSLEIGSTDSVSPVV